MKKSCDGCRADSKETCRLGYQKKVQRIRIDDRSYFDIWTPAELCPKPKTWTAFFNSDQKQALSGLKEG